MEYGYEKRDHRGNLVYPMHPVQEEECRKACDVHNGYHGWTKGEVDAIFFKSITEQYPEETKE